MNSQIFKLDLENAEESEIKFPTSVGTSKKKESTSKTATSALLIHQNLCVDHNKLWEILQEMRIPDHLPTSWEIYIQVKKQQVELDLEQWTGSKLGKEYVKAVYCHPAYLTYMQSTSCEMPDWMKHKLESRFLKEVSITSDMQMTPSLWQKVKQN